MGLLEQWLVLTIVLALVASWQIAGWCEQVYIKVRDRINS